MGILAIVGVVVSLVLFGLGAYDAYAYRVGTPTTATINQCINATKGSSKSCTGTWSVGGKSYTGPIGSGGLGYSQGSSQNVRVHGGTAYTADAASRNLWGGTTFAVLSVPAGLVVLVVWWLRRNKRKTAGRTLRS